MNFQLTGQQEAIQKKVRAFAESKVAPRAMQMDADSGFPLDLMLEMGKLGLLGLPYPQKYGGAGEDNVSYAIAVEEMSRVDGGLGVALSVQTSLAGWPIWQFGTEEQKNKYLAALARGEKIGSFCLTERNAGSDAGGTETFVVDKGDHFVLNGEKIFITNAEVADIFVVFAAMGQPRAGSRNLCALIVEKGWPGFTLGQHYDKMGIRDSGTSELVFTDVKVPRENLLGKMGEGFKIAMQTLDGGRIGIAAQALGIAQGAFEQALEYAKIREQFGKPIGAQQYIAFKLAEMATRIRAARFMVYSAAWNEAEHKPYAVEAAMAKMYASEMCLEVVNNALQIFGGNGYIKGFPVERMYRDAKITTIYEGTNEIQRLVIASALLGRLKSAAAPARPLEESGKKSVFKEGSARQRVDAFVKYLKDNQVLAGDAGNNKSLATARRAVAIGMGCKDKADLAMIEKLADELKAAFVCSRPLAEERQWMPMSAFVGISGARFSGDFYLAIGISGQMQHQAGIKGCKFIAAINTDPDAPIFEISNAGIVGDMYEIVPLLAKALADF